MSQKKQTNQHNNAVIKEQTIKSSTYDEYFDTFEFKLKPISQRWLEHTAGELLKWATQDPKAYKITQFPIERGISLNDFYRYCRENRYMKEAHAMALAAIGNRREVGALEKNLDSSMVRAMMPHYDTEWREMHEWQSKLKEEAQGNGGTQIVVLEKIPDSEMVPSKKTPEEVAAYVHKRTANDKFNGGEAIRSRRPKE